MGKKVAYAGMMIALAFVFGYIENVAIRDVFIPGIKIGLANIVVIVALWKFGNKMAFTVSIIRVVLSGATYGNAYSFVYSVSGGMCALILMIVLKKYTNFSVKGVSVAGAVAHNVAQLLVAVILLGNKWLFVSYLPLLLISGVIMGLVTGVIGTAVMKRMIFSERL
ncbi:MAG: Gx transporter family protein [Lachnospiraceae bacterium]|nr:Gx transporter family protein [Lachnospiraceae bacterium]